MSPVLMIGFTREEWEAIRNAVAARGDSIYDARAIIEHIELSLQDWREDE